MRFESVAVMMKRQFRILAIFVASSFWLACKSEAPRNEAETRPTPQSLTQSAAGLTPAPEIVTTAPSNFKKTFVGTIGDNLAVQMDIERDGSKIKGDYFYDKPGAYNLADKLLNLNGKVDKDGNVTLNESRYDPESGKEKPTGTFNGKLDAVSSNNLSALRLTGTWTSAKEKKSFAVKLKELSFDLSGLKLADKKMKDSGNRNKYELESNLPQLTGDDTAKVEKFNRAIDNFVSKRTADFKKTAVEMAKDAADSSASNPG